MKILILANSDLGLYNFRKELLEAFIDSGNEVYISLPYGERVDLLEKMGCKFIDTKIDRRGINPFTDIRLIRFYIKLVSRIKPDKVIAYTIKPNIYGGISCRLKKVPMYANITGLGTAFENNGVLSKLVTFLYKSALKRANIVFFENEENRKIFVDKGIIPVIKSHVLHGAGVNLDDYAFSDYPDNKAITNFLFIGRIMKEKGIDELFEAAERFKKEGINARFDIVGPFEDDYENTVNELSNKGIIHYYGLQTNVKPFISKAHCFVLPSYHEGMANTLLECGAMGRPLITSNIHGCLEAVRDGETGYLCNPKDSDDLYKKLKRFMYIPYEEQKEMGRLSHEYVASIFDKKKVVEETMKFIFCKTDAAKIS